MQNGQALESMVKQYLVEPLLNNASSSPDKAAAARGPVLSDPALYALAVLVVGVGILAAWKWRHSRVTFR